jgi:hypothetical protein
MEPSQSKHPVYESNFSPISLLASDRAFVYFFVVCIYIRPINQYKQRTLEALR